MVARWQFLTLISLAVASPPLLGLRWLKKWMFGKIEEIWEVHGSYITGFPFTILWRSMPRNLRASQNATQEMWTENSTAGNVPWWKWLTALGSFFSELQWQSPHFDMYWATAMASSIPPVPCVGGALACLQLCCVHETYELQRKKTVDACCIICKVPY